MDEDWFLVGYKAQVQERKRLGMGLAGLLERTMPDGVLFDLGCIFFDRLFSVFEDAPNLEPDVIVRRAWAAYFTLAKSGIDTRNEPFAVLAMTIGVLDDVVQENPSRRAKSLVKRRGIDEALHDAFLDVEDMCRDDIQKVRKLYSRDFAERAFHDRQLCEYVAIGLAVMWEEGGVPVAVDNAIEIRKAKRQKWPPWVLLNLFARERGRCPNCGVGLSELEAEAHIDHIVPLHVGGCNDVVNLQLLCGKCNVKKQARQQLVRSSVNAYFNWPKVARARGAFRVRSNESGE